MDIKKYILGHCVHPVEVKVFDTYSNTFVVRQLPCGKCLHCRTTHVNEWVTRLYAHAQYSNYVYYITLDYAPFSYEKDTFSDSTAYQLAVDTASVWHNINSTHRYGMQPLLLRKSHLQNFFKRFRKNTNIPFQYFACGEYGTHAEGKGYGRPHFHVILFSELPISQEQIEHAWTLNGYKIGKVKYEDITTEAKCPPKNITTSNNAKNVFKYVCKYLQKGNFDFEKLATINYHRAYFKSMQFQFDETCTLFEPQSPITNKQQINVNWFAYCREFAPFVVASKRPSIGFAYFKENIQRFKERDFRLFGLPDECDAFPYYFLRKTKEFLCPISAIGEVSNNPSSNSRIGNVLSLLREIRSAQLSIPVGPDSVPTRWCVCDFYNPDKSSKERRLFREKDSNHVKESLPLSALHMYDNQNKVFYQFNGYGYTTWQKVKKLGYVRLCELCIDEVLNYVSPIFDSYYNNYVAPMHDIQVLKEKELYDTIDKLYIGDCFERKYELFLKDIDSTLQGELLLDNKKQLLTQNSRNVF